MPIPAHCRMSSALLLLWATEAGDELAELGDRHKPDLGELPIRGAGSRHDGPGEPQFRGLLKALIHMAYRPHRASEAYLAEIDRVLRCWPAGKGREQRR